jgi:hypothetical protein
MVDRPHFTIESHSSFESVAFSILNHTIVLIFTIFSSLLNFYGEEAP